jgi:GrpB-like predicted nucleotidyltransferase (UPF0157 family)
MIDVVSYDPEWPREFERARDQLQSAFGNVAERIEHHGSTAVPGLSAKPIIDIQISVARLQPMDLYARPLIACGYIHVPHSDDDRCPFFHRPAEWPHRHHVHVVEAGSREELQTLMFRDYLRSHPDAARQYESLKRELARVHDGNDAASREAYANAKTAFVAEILGRAAVESGRARSDSTA